MQLRTAVRSISAAAVAGGLTLGLGVSSPATAMPVHDRAESLGRLCHAAAQARATEPGAAPSSIEGLPGLRCGQAFGRAALAGDDAEETAYDDEPTYIDATEAEDSDASDASDDTTEPDDADDAYPEQSDDADEPEESEDAYESDDAEDDSDSSESEDDSEESHEQEDADYDDGGDDVDDGTEHSEHHDD